MGPWGIRGLDGFPVCRDPPAPAVCPYPSGAIPARAGSELHRMLPVCPDFSFCIFVAGLIFRGCCSALPACGCDSSGKEADGDPGLLEASG